MTAGAANGRYSHGMNGTPTYRSWQAMLTRCTNSNRAQFKDYGGRGIKVCERWLKFENFLADMGERPDGTTLDRFPNKDGDYEPGNCRWASRVEQNRNTRSNLQLTFCGKTQLAAQWADELGIKRYTLYARLNHYGWTVERALTTPVRS